MTTVTTPPCNVESRRVQIQSIARASFRRRQFYSGVALSLIALALLIAFVPLFSILQNVIGKGMHVVTWAFITKPQQLPGIIDRNAIGGVSNAITGSLVIDGIALLLAVPAAILLSIAFFEFNGRVMSVIRTAVETMVGLPSILFGLLMFTLLVQQTRHYTGIAGALALALMMVPLMTVACEAALRDVPRTIHEAAVALGAKPSRIMHRVIFPYALPRMLTGIFLSLSRAVGETAPVLLVIGANLLTNWNPLGPQTSLPTLTLSYVGSQYPALRYACWGIALILISVVFVLNLTSRVVTARSNKGR